MTAENLSAHCRVCGCADVEKWLYPCEMMFGTRERFTYFRCAGCGCLQIIQTPADLSRYYPDGYYSYQRFADTTISFKGAIKRKLINPLMTKHLIGQNSRLGQLFCRLVNHPPVPQWLRFLARSIEFDSSVLDVGCGSGMHLLMMRNCGFTNLRGVDPYIAKPVTYSGGVQIDNCGLGDVQGRFDLIMFHHVFEHVDDPMATLRQTRQLLSKGGQILIRIPLSDSVAAQKYKEKWVQLDAPRHITLQTRKSMDLLAQQVGLRIARVEYDSTEFQFWGSEQYVRDIPLFDERSYHTNKSGSVFSPEQIKAFTGESERLNREAKGDQAAFVLEGLNA